MSLNLASSVKRFASQNLFDLLVARRKSVVVARRKAKHILAVASELTGPNRGWAYIKLSALESTPLL